MTGQACAAERGGTLSVGIKGLPLARLQLSFVGAGEGTVPSDSLELLAETERAELGVPMDWKSGSFIGEHWLLGRFLIEMDVTKKSEGRIFNFRKEGAKNVATHENAFFFTLRSRRFPSVRVTTQTPIVNEAEIEAIPPVGSVYRLKGDSPVVRIARADGSNGFSTTLNFKYCDITIYPQQNIAIAVNEISYSGNTAEVKIDVRNLTNQDVRATYFIVDHEDGLEPVDDGVFFNIAANASETTTFRVKSSKPGVEAIVPLFAGIYKPEALRGSARTDLNLKFPD